MFVYFQCKCAQYWPDQGCWTYGNIRVSVEDVTVLVDYTVRKFCIQQVLSSASFPGSHLGSAKSAGIGWVIPTLIQDAQELLSV